MSNCLVGIILTNNRRDFVEIFVDCALEECDNLANLFLVCKKFFSVSKTALLWTRLCERENYEVSGNGTFVQYSRFSNTTKCLYFSQVFPIPSDFNNATKNDIDRCVGECIFSKNLMNLDVLIAGDRRVGKSSFIARLRNNEFVAHCHIDTG